MLIQLPLLVRIAVVASIVLAYYFGVKKLLFAGARLMSVRLRRFTRHSRSEIQGVLELGFAVAGHLVLVAGLVAFSGVQVEQLGLTGNPLLLPLGAFVGVGELAVAMFACQIVITAVTREHVPASGALLRSSATAKPTSSWLSASRAGWVRHHVSSLKVLPVPASMSLSGAQVACEELVFRSVLGVLFQDASIATSIIIPGLLFVIMQVFFMPSVQAAMFPVIGATVMALVHGFLFASMPFIWPLVIAHAVFFYTAVL